MNAFYSSTWLISFQPLKDIAVVGGSMARFECIVQCDPYPQINWSHNGASIENDGGKYEIVFRNGVCRLTIPRAFTCKSWRIQMANCVSLNIHFIFTADAGQYTCTGTNQIGVATTSAALIVPGDQWNVRKWKPSTN